MLSSLTFRVSTHAIRNRGFSERAMALPSDLFKTTRSVRPKRRHMKKTPQKDAVASRVADQSGSAMAGWACLSDVAKGVRELIGMRDDPGLWRYPGLL